MTQNVMDSAQELHMCRVVGQRGGEKEGGLPGVTLSDTVMSSSFQTSICKVYFGKVYSSTYQRVLSFASLIIKAFLFLVIILWHIFRTN